MRAVLRRFIKRLEAPERPTHELAMRFPGVTISVPENVTIGARVSIGNEVVISADSPISIGDDTMIGMRTLLLTATHRYKNHPMWEEKVSHPLAIGSHVWIGAGSILLPGVKVGDFAVIGAGSVINRHVPERAIVAGNPARIIRFRELDDLMEQNEGRSIPYPGVCVYEDFLPDEFLTAHKQ